MTERLDRRRVLFETVTAATVVASLVFVALEVRQNTAAIRASAIQDLSATTSEYLNAWTTDDRIPGLFARVSSGERSDAFTAEENQRIAFMYMSALRSYEARYLQMELGVLDEDVLHSMTGASVMFDDAWFADAWPRFEPLVGRGFASFMRERYGLP